MLPKILLSEFLTLFLLLSALPCLAKDAARTIKTGTDVTTEFWDGKVLTARFRAGMCFEPSGKARGVLILRHANGKEDTYHLYGTLKNGQFSLSHGSGHEFSGSFSGEDEMTGKVRLANGLRLSLKGKRHKNAVLAEPDCAPMQ